MLQIVRRITGLQLDELAIALEAPIIACDLDHNKVMIKEHDAKALSLVVVASCNVHFVLFTLFSSLSVPAAAGSRFALSRK